MPVRFTGAAVIVVVVVVRRITTAAGAARAAAAAAAGYRRVAPVRRQLDGYASITRRTNTKGENEKYFCNFRENDREKKNDDDDVKHTHTHNGATEEKKLLF